MHCARNAFNQLDRWDHGEGKEEAGDGDLPDRVLMRRRDGGGGGSPHPPLSNVGNVGNLRWGEGGGEGVVVVPWSLLRMSSVLGKMEDKH